MQVNGRGRRELFHVDFEPGLLIFYQCNISCHELLLKESKIVEYYLSRCCWHRRGRFFARAGR